MRETNDPKTQSPDYEALREAAAAAEAAGLGVFMGDPDARAASVFRFDTGPGDDAAAFVAARGKGCPVAGIVDQARPHRCSSHLVHALGAAHARHAHRLRAR